MFTFASDATRRQHTNGVISSKEYVREFYNWIKPKDARNNETFRALIEKVTGSSYSTFGHWQSDGSPNIKEKASLCFGASAQFHDTHIEEHFARFLYFWNSYREENPVQPDFWEYETKRKKLWAKYRLIPNEQHPFAAQLQRHLYSAGFEHKKTFDDIKNFIDTHSSGYVTIEGKTDTEKSSLTAYTAITLYESGQYQCIWHFNEMGSGHNKSADLLRTLFSQLRDMYACLDDDKFNLEYKQVLNSDSGYGGFYRTVFDQLAYDRKFQNSKLVIFVDALDEVSRFDLCRQESINTLFIPQGLIKNTFVIVTSKNFTRETYIGNKLEINLSQIKSYETNKQSVTGNNCELGHVEDEKKWQDPYSFDWFGFASRKKEFKRLNQFINHDDQFKIWAISGPAGAGKTWLAHQWAVHSSALKGWNRVPPQENRSELKEWLKWPDKPTLIIIECRYDFDEVTSKLLKYCLESRVSKVRLLVIDRVFSVPLHSDKRWKFSSDASSLNCTETYFFAKKPLDLRQTDDQEEIIKEIIARHANIKNVESPQINEAHDYLLNMKGAYYPLYAVLVGEAIRDKRPYRLLKRKDVAIFELLDE
ncbi:hypothetical protein [Nitrosospira sp. NpAV]|uniref:hypothetical protein n=1 Tax=Nitrosospira sp. NpAV TaxID=58133 RepID=UPI0005A20746|nr:hypothetical protein [Nitrosospira sp. NpAV]KIO48287.1 hypothetical protein SQ11_12500 [Nitrosospira sp. NpAV]